MLESVPETNQYLTTGLLNETNNNINNNNENGVYQSTVLVQLISTKLSYVRYSITTTTTPPPTTTTKGGV